MADIEKSHDNDRFLAQLLLGSIYTRVFYFCTLMVVSFVFCMFSLYLWRQFSAIGPYLAPRANFDVFHVFAGLVALHSTIAIIYFEAAPKLGPVLQKILSILILCATALIFVYTSYVHGFKSIWTGFYFAVFILLGIVVFNQFVNRVLVAAIAAIAAVFIYVIDIGWLPGSPFFANDIALTPKGLYYLSHSTLTGTLAAIVMFLFFHQTLMNSRDNRENYLARISQTDVLSGLLNRDQITLVMQRQIEEVIASSYANLGIIVADIDFFKKINDSHGHAMGDKVIQEFALLLKTQVEQTGFAGRYGGEEFLLVLPNTSARQCQAIAESIRLLFSETTISFNGEQCWCTASFGTVNASELAHASLSMDSLFKIADARLYIAKNNGRNLVVSEG